MSGLLIILSVLCALAYGSYYTHQPVSAPRTVTKTISIAALALFAYLAGGSWTLVAALGFSALGDFFLSREGDTAFLAGMVAFFTAHLAYIPIFLGLGDAELITSARLPFALTLVLFAALIYRLLWPGLGSFRLPVAIYCLAIAAMGISALSLPLEYPAMLALAGALSFIISDSFLAFEKFRPAESARLRAASPYLVWLFYWSGQVLIAAGVMLTTLGPSALSL